MGLFDELDLKNAPADPNAIPNGDYVAYLTDVKPGTSQKAPDHKYVIFQYKIEDDGPYNGAEISEWKSADPSDDERKKGWLKQRLISLGVPEDRVDEVEPDDIIGTKVVLQVKQNGQYTNVNRVTLYEDTSSF